MAPRHVEAIYKLGGNLVAFTDPHDCVGWMDLYFPHAQYFKEFERFDRYCSKFVRKDRIDYVVVASPNYLHDAHCRWGLRIDADVICEKPLVLNDRNLDGLQVIEEECGRRVWTILQLRLHDAAIQAKARYSVGSGHIVKVEYNSPRGAWYKHSWKGDVSKSGGLETNIGIHLFDLVAWMFGQCENMSPGRIVLDRAFVDWSLSIDPDKPPMRKFEIDGEEIELSNGFGELHTLSYQKILTNRGFGIEDAREAIRICQDIRYQ